MLPLTDKTTVAVEYVCKPNLSTAFEVQRKLNTINDLKKQMRRKEKIAVDEAVLQAAKEALKCDPQYNKLKEELEQLM